MSNVTPIPQPKTGAVSTASPSDQKTGEVARSGAEVVRLEQRRRVRRLIMQLALWVGVPTLLAITYYGFIAPGEYESSAVVMPTRGGDSELGSRAVLLTEYLASREALDELEKSVEISSLYERGSDPLFGLSDDAGNESVYKFYQDHSSIRHDARTGVVRVKARAFRGQDAKVIAQAMLDSGERFLNRVAPGEGRTVVVVARPSLPSEATYPQRLFGVATTFLAAFAVYGIGALLIAALREHAHL